MSNEKSKKLRVKDMITFEELLEQELKRPGFRKAWEESQPQYQLTRQLINSRIEKEMTQQDLAKKANTTQAVISRVEGMNMNPSLKLMYRLAKALDKELVIEFR